MQEAITYQLYENIDRPLLNILAVLICLSYKFNGSSDAICRRWVNIGSDKSMSPGRR